VLAIIVTAMVLELKVPPAAELADLKPLLPVFLSWFTKFPSSVPSERCSTQGSIWIR
jgi:uncharacterized membrane protein